MQRKRRPKGKFPELRKNFPRLSNSSLKSNEKIPRSSLILLNWADNKWISPKS